MNAAHHLAAWTLPNELRDHPIRAHDSLCLKPFLTHVETVMANFTVVYPSDDIEDLGRNVEGGFHRG